MNDSNNIFDNNNNNINNNGIFPQQPQPVPNNNINGISPNNNVSNTTQQSNMTTQGQVLLILKHLHLNNP